MSQNTKILCLDYGRERIGVAVSYGALAEPLLVLAYDDSLPSKLVELVDEYGVEQLLVGISDGAMALESKQFGEQLGRVLDLPVSFADETLSSQTAERKYASVASVARRKAALDHLAAAEILQQWLDEHL